MNDVANGAAPTEAIAPGGTKRGTTRRPVRRRRLWTIAALLLTIGAAVTYLATTRPTSAPASGNVANKTDNTVATVAIERRTLSSQTKLAGTLGYAEHYTVVNNLGGYYTELPQAGEGQIVKQGDVLYRVGAKPVVLLNGTIAAWRALRVGDTGSDVAQLNADLAALGLMSPSATPGTFDAETEHAVRKLQERIGAAPTGMLALGDVVFLPAPLRIVSVGASLGTPAHAGTPIIEATSVKRVITAQLSASEQALVKVGERVNIFVNPGGINEQRMSGMISKVETVANVSSGSADASPTFGVQIAPENSQALGPYDQLPVQVAITNASVADALVVPVTALMALAGQGYAVEVVGTDGTHRLVPVQLGIFNDSDGLVQVKSPELQAGQRVVVAAL